MTSTKVQNYEKVKATVLDLNYTFTINEIRDKTGLHYDQCKKYLKTMEEFGLIKYSETTKLYMRLK